MWTLKTYVSWLRFLVFVGMFVLRIPLRFVYFYLSRILLVLGTLLLVFNDADRWPGLAMFEAAGAACVSCFLYDLALRLVAPHALYLDD